MGNNVRRTIRIMRVMPAVALALLLAIQVVGAAPAHAAPRSRRVGPNTCLWTPDASTSHNITLNGQVGWVLSG